MRVEDAGACPRFASRVIEGVDPSAPTPDWMKTRLERSGIRSISAIVDVTNYVMLELGQPLHAYDRALLEGDVVVRFARPQEQLLLLNGETLDLEPDLLMVCDERKPLGLAGIMGGEYSGIATTTRDVFLEGAFWSPAVIQGKMRRLGFASDAGHRFERGVDFELPPAAVERATELIVAICGGRAGPLQDVVGPLPAREPVRVRASRVERLLGIRALDRDDRRHLHAPRLRLRPRRRRVRRHAAVVPLRPRARGGLRRGDRAHARLREHPGGACTSRVDDAAAGRRPALDRRWRGRGSSRATGRRW